jgi:hypothetical protein
MNSFTSTLIAAVFGGLLSIVPATFSASAANDSVPSSVYSEGNFYGTAKLDTSQVTFSAPPKVLCYITDTEHVTCYRKDSVPSGVSDFDLVWVGDRLPTAF